MITIPAVFEHGVFKPNAPVDLPSGAKVDLIVAGPQDDPVAIMKARFPNSFGGLSDEDAEAMRKAIEEECERIDPNDWK
jgi:predicted DNA-binding antitoxin AbrB/MazE fold protein